jgi:hypothetical protein
MIQSRWQGRTFSLLLVLALEALGCRPWIRIEALDPSEGTPRFRFSSNIWRRGVDLDYLTVETQATRENVCFLLISDPSVRGIETWQYGQSIPGSRMEGCVPPLPSGRYRVRIKAGNGTWPYKDFEVKAATQAGERNTR